MHIAIDILAAIILLFFLLAGWHKGFLLSLLGVVRVILAYGTAYFAGRYLGFWLGEIAQRPRIVTIPTVAGLTFVFVTFFFHVWMSNIREKHKDREKKEDFKLPIHSCLGGAVINTLVGLFSLILLFWLADLSLVGLAGRSIPGAEKSLFGQFARRTVYETIYLVSAKKGRESQAAATARVVSNPARGMDHLKTLVGTESFQQLSNDRDFGKALLSGEAVQIEQNASFQRFFNDPIINKEMRELGLHAGSVDQKQLSEKLAKFADNEKIQMSLENLKAKDLLRTDRIGLLIRDPDFDIILSELMK